MRTTTQQHINAQTKVYGTLRFVLCSGPDHDNTTQHTIIQGFWLGLVAGNPGVTRQGGTNNSCLLPRLPVNVAFSVRKNANETMIVAVGNCWLRTLTTSLLGMGEQGDANRCAYPTFEPWLRDWKM